MAAIDELKRHEGEEIGVGDWFEVTQERIDRFADATNDHQWIHVDPERAKEGPFGVTIAHGFLTLSLIPGLGGGGLPVAVEGVKMGINYGLDRARFISPVPVGSKVRARRKLLEATEAKDGSIQLKTEVTIELEGSEKPACVAETLTRLYT